MICFVKDLTALKKIQEIKHLAFYKLSIKVHTKSGFGMW